MDARHKKRIETVQNLYALSFDNPSRKTDFIDEQVKSINQNLKEIDILIKKYAPKYPIDKIAKTDLAILRLSIYELMIERRNPPKVVINEAVELARELGSDHSYAFINGVLGAIMEQNSKH